MAEESTTPAPEAPFEHTRRDAKRAQWALNSLVIFSALSGAVFFFYVLSTIRPFGSKDADNVEVPTSSVGARYGLLVGVDEASGLGVVLRDIDEAPEYRDKLSDTMRTELGISESGRLYLLGIRNDGAAPVSVAAEALQVTDEKGASWTVRWLDQTAGVETAGPTGRLRLAQSARKFELGKGEERQLFIFISANSEIPPPAEDFSGGLLKLASGLEIALNHTETKAAQ
jgi:hypothetical protein